MARVYIENASQAPEGANVQRGPNGGLYYEASTNPDASTPSSNDAPKKSTDWEYEVYNSEERSDAARRLSAQGDTEKLYRSAADFRVATNNARVSAKEHAAVLFELNPDLFAKKFHELITNALPYNDQAVVATIVRNLNFLEDADEKKRILKTIYDKLGMQEAKYFLRYTRWKGSVTSKGVKTSEEQDAARAAKMAKLSIDGLQVEVAPEFVKATKGKTADVEGFTREALTHLPDPVKQYLKDKGVRVVLIGKKAAQNETGSSNVHAGGQYFRKRNTIFIYPQTFEEFDHYSVTPEKLEELRGRNALAYNFTKEGLEKAGLPLRVVDQIRSISTGRSYLIRSLLHEMGHAVALSDTTGDSFLTVGGHQGDFDKVRNQAIAGGNQGFVSRYAGTNNREDFAETFAFYALHQYAVNKALDSGADWVGEGLKKKLEYMRELWQRSSLSMEKK